MMRINNNSGLVFVMAVSVMVILSILGTAYLIGSKDEIEVGRADFDNLLAFYRAEAGIEHMKAKLTLDGLATDSTAEYKPGGSGPADYYVSYTSATQTIESDGGNSDDSYFLRLEAVVEQKRFTGALQAGGNIDSVASVTGTLTGDVDAAGATVNTGSLTVNGTATPSSLVTVPAVDMNSYLNDTPVGNRYSGWPSWATGPPNGDGMYHVNGNLTVSSSFVLNGTLVVTGLLTVSSIPWDGFQITPSGNNPAIVAGNIAISSVQRPAINGLIFSNGYINLSTADQMTVTGSIVCGGDLTFTSVSALTLTYDDTMDPPYFSGGGGGIETTSWVGHDMP